MRQDPRTTQEIHLDNACDMVMDLIAVAPQLDALYLLDIVEELVNDSYVATVLDMLADSGVDNAREALGYWISEQSGDSEGLQS